VLGLKDTIDVIVMAAEKFESWTLGRYIYTPNIRLARDQLRLSEVLK
jgi:hypothetical protein